MIFALLHSFITLVLDVFATVGIAANEKDLEIALLRQQLRILERKGKVKRRLVLPEKLMLVVLVGKLNAKAKHYTNGYERVWFWLSRKLCSSGIATWYVASGPFASPTKAGDHGSMPSWKR